MICKNPEQSCILVRIRKCVHTGDGLLISLPFICNTVFTSLNAAVFISLVQKIDSMTIQNRPY